MTTSTLHINSLELPINLGWPKEERSRKQVVKLDIEINFPTVPDACKSDDIKDTICYRELIETLRDQLGEKNFHLIEHLTQEVHKVLKSRLPDQSKTNVSLTKKPQIQGLGSVTFNYSDDI